MRILFCPLCRLPVMEWTGERVEALLTEEELNKHRGHKWLWEEQDTVNEMVVWKEEAK